MSKFEIKLTEWELDQVRVYIEARVFPKTISKTMITRCVFEHITDWNIRKVREAVSRLQAKGYQIIAHHGGYSVFGDDPQPVIEYLNREYKRIPNIMKKNDQIFHALKQKYGDAVGAKVEQMPGQPMLDNALNNVVAGLDNGINGSSRYVRTLITSSGAAEPPFRKSIDARGNEIALQFQADA